MNQHKPATDGLSEESRGVEPLCFIYYTDQVRFLPLVADL